MREALYILTHCPAISDESLGGDFLGGSSNERTQEYKAPLDGGLYIPSAVLEQAVDRLIAFAGYSHPRGVADTMVRAESIYLAVQRGSGRTQVRILSPLAKKDHTTHQREIHQNNNDTTRQ